MIKKQNGFTLLEMIIVCALFLLITTTAIPSMRSLYIRNTINAIHSDFLFSLHFARSTAIYQRAKIVMCSLSDQILNSGDALSSVKCSADAQWQNGWIVYRDTNRNGTLDTDINQSCTTDKDCILKVYPPITQGFRINTSRRSSVAFNNRGRTSDAATWIICGPQLNPNSATAVILASGGRARTAGDGNSNGLIELSNGRDLEHC